MNAKSISFEVMGKPATQGSKKWIGGKQIVDTCKELMKWRAKIKYYAKCAKGETYYSKPQNIKLTLRFFLARPKIHYNALGQIKAAYKNVFPSVRPDLLKMARAVEDAMSGIIYDDDSQITCEQMSKAYVGEGQREGVFVIVEAGSNV